MIKKRIVINAVIIFSFIFSIILSIFYLSKYDSYQLDGITHIMLKEETYYHWFQAALIVEQIKNGTSFFTAGGEMFTKALPQRLVALYSYVTDLNIVDNWQNNRISLGGKFPFLFTQSLIYYFSVFIFFKQISKLLDYKIILPIIFFLCLEPTIFQYHSSFWTESFYFSIQLLILSLMLMPIEKNVKYLIIGTLLGILFTQRSAGIFYIIIIIFFYFFTIEKNKFKKISLIVLPYLFICLLLGIHNYKRAGIFYVMPTEGKYGMYKYFAKNILVEANKSSINEVNKLEVKKSLIWIKNNIENIDYTNLENINSPYEIGLALKNEKQKIKFYGYINKRSYEILFDNPIITFKKVISGFIHFSILNPFFIYSDNEYYKDYSSSIIGDFVFSEKHKNYIPIRMLYTFLLYLICFIGFIDCMKKNTKLSILLVISILYYYLILGWYGKTRLFTPCLIYLSIFFGYGLNSILNRFKIYKGNY